MVGSKVLSSTSIGGDFFLPKDGVYEENRILYN